MEFPSRRWEDLTAEGKPLTQIVMTGSFLALFAYSIDTFLPLTARILHALFIAIIHIRDTPPLAAVFITLMTISHLITYSVSFRGAMSLYYTADMALMTLYYFNLHLRHDQPFDQHKLKLQLCLNLLRTYIPLTSILFHWRYLFDHYVPNIEKWGMPQLAGFRLVYLGLLAVFVYVRLPMPWLLSLTGRLRILDDWLRLVWRRLIYYSRRSLRVILEKIGKLSSSWEQTPRYEYKDLGQRQIRLLSVRRRTIFSGIIETELLVVNLNNAPSYEAISYTWGDPTLRHEISIDGCRFRTTANIQDMLHARRSIWRERLLWVDFVCINQGDRSEKECQIPLMKEIYQNANRVVVWLGDDPEAPAAAAMAQHVFTTSYIQEKSRGNLFNTYSPYAKLHSWYALTNLFHHPYFSRVWICQEISVAPNVQLYHGGTYIQWEVWMRILTACSDPRVRSLLGIVSARQAKSGHCDLDQNSGDLHIVKICIQEKVPVSIGFVLSLSASFKSTLPHDRIYAILGIPTDNNSINISPDYNKPTHHLYTEFAEKLLLSKGNAIPILSFAGIGFQGGVRDLPSWAPDWTSPRLNRPLSLFVPPGLVGLAKVIAPDQSQESNSRYFASKNSEPRITLGPISRTIKIACIRVGLISHLGGVYDARHKTGDLTRSWELMEGIFQWHQEAKRLFQETAVSNPYGNDAARDEAFWRTLIADSMHMKLPAAKSIGRQYEYWRDMAESGLRQYRLGKGHKPSEDFWKKYEPYLKETFRGPKLKTAMPRSEALKAAHQRWSHAVMLYGEFGAQLQHSAGGRHFCITDQGYLGLAPPRSQLNDMVCVVLGAQVPFLLREVHENDKEYSSSTSLYRLVGECYVQGIMNGEFMDNMGQVETFTLI